MNGDAMVRPSGALGDTTTALAANAAFADAPASAKILVREVVKLFGRGETVHALGPVDLVVEAGEFVCIVGPSGCGKSTLLRIIAGLTNPSAGTIEIAHSDREAVCTAMVFQDHGVYPWKTVEANVRLGLDIARVRRAEANVRVKDWLRRMHLTDFADMFPRTLSGGMRQRVAIARALVLQPEVLLMDEPFAALDVQLRTLLQEELLQLWQEDQRTVVFVTHSIDEALLLGDRVLVMSARPGTLLREFRVPFERPRSPELRGTPEFAALEQEIWSLLRHEVTIGSGADG